MYTMGQFREITKDLPDDTEIKIEAFFTPDQNGSAAVHNIIASKNTKEVVLLPEAVYISDGTNALKVEQGKK